MHIVPLNISLSCGITLVKEIENAEVQFHLMQRLIFWEDHVSISSPPYYHLIPCILSFKHPDPQNTFHNITGPKVLLFFFHQKCLDCAGSALLSFSQTISPVLQKQTQEWGTYWENKSICTSHCMNSTKAAEKKALRLH